MLRVLLVLVAVLAAVLAFVFDQPWLYAAAAVPLLGALGLLGRYFWIASQHSSSQAESMDPPDDSLEDLGIMDVRPQDREGGANGTSDPSHEDGAEDPTPASTSDADDPGPENPQAPQEERLDQRRAERRGTPPEAPSENDEGVQSDDRPVLGPLLESLRAAIGAQTVCLLVQEEVVLDYQIAALASLHSNVQTNGSFETQSPLLSASMSRQPVTIRSLEKEDRDDLCYYETAPSITQVAIAPLSRPDTSASVFLLADATAETELDTSQVRSLLKRYAETVGSVLDSKEAEETSASSQEVETADMEPEPTPQGQAEEGAVDPANGTEPPKRDGTPRPRREIIAEEMEAADVASDPLALVLVLLNRYESIAREGETAVERAEHHFRTRLENLAPGQRVERFGELTYGIFLRREMEAVEVWALDLQDAMARETGELEGGVSIGVAVRDARHTPEELRGDATEALLEAYETGECAIKA